MKKENKKWKWKFSETIDINLSEKEISDLINKKLAYIIIELEHNPANYVVRKNIKKEDCSVINDAV